MKKSLEKICKEIEVLEKLKEWGFKYRQTKDIKDIEDIDDDEDLSQFIHDYIDIGEINGLIRTKLEEADSELKSYEGPVILEPLEISLRNTKMAHYSGYLGAEGYIFDDKNEEGE